MSCSTSACQNCPSAAKVKRLGLDLEKWDAVVALAGNPNTGKSTVFNRLTGLRQHTGNWPGKTIARAEGGFSYAQRTYKIVDLPGTYSLLSSSPDEEVARDFVLFGKPDVTVVVLDATALERNLNLALQILQITGRVVVCLNLMDEARAHGIQVDAVGLSSELGVPVIPCAARRGEGIPELLEAIQKMAAREVPTAPRRLDLAVPGFEGCLHTLCEAFARVYPRVPHREWIALRLLSGDASVSEAVASGEIGSLGDDHAATGVDEGLTGAAAGETLAGGQEIVRMAEELRWRIPPTLHDTLTERIYAESARIAAMRVVQREPSLRARWQRQWDGWLTHPATGFPLMLAIFCVVLWLTIEGANVPSGFLADLLVGQGHPWFRGLLEWLKAPSWVVGVVADGMYLAAAWVVSVMLPPMAIFFPAFTLLEDLGYLPRVAFNLDRVFQRVGAHGKQALTMSMGFGCNAAGVVACRVIDSPRERIIAIITNNFALCNGRWPTQILVATLFVGAMVPPALAGLAATGAVVTVALAGVCLTFLCSWGLSRTVLQGEVSTFSLELPPYRPPHFLRTLYTSLVDRTLFVLWRAVVFAVPAGALIWIIGTVSVGGQPLASLLAGWLDPLAWSLGLTGVILLAYVVAIPANEIVVPTILMLTVVTAGLSGLGAGSGVMFEAEDAVVREVLLAGGWTPLTAVCLMIFSLCHNPCSTTIYTIYQETKSWRWTLLATLLPLVLGVVLCAVVAAVWRVFL